MAKKRVYAYYDGSNFYHNSKKNYGITRIKYDDLTNHMLDLSKEELVKIRYFNCPVNQQEDPQAYVEQQKFLDIMKKTPFVELSLGNLVPRRLAKININCQKCGHQKVDLLFCPTCKKQINIFDCYKSWEKGVDVKLAIYMLLDAITDKYDIALLFSGDSDFCPAVKYIVKQLNKEIVYCCFPRPKTFELIQTCSSYRIITFDSIKKSMPSNSI